VGAAGQKARCGLLWPLNTKRMKNIVDIEHVVLFLFLLSFDQVLLYGNWMSLARMVGTLVFLPPPLIYV